MIVALDIDGVLLDFERAWLDCARIEYGQVLEKRCDSYCLAERYGITKRQEQQITRHLDWSLIELLPGAVQLVESLYDLDCTVYGITNTDPVHARDRAESLIGILDRDSIFFLGADAAPETRARMVKSLRAAAFLDDLPENVNAVHAAQVPIPVFVDRGYDHAHTLDSGITVIDDLRDFPVVIEHAAAFYPKRKRKANKNRTMIRNNKMLHGYVY